MAQGSLDSLRALAGVVPPPADDVITVPPPQPLPQGGAIAPIPPRHPAIKSDAEIMSAPRATPEEIVAGRINPANSPPETTQQQGGVTVNTLEGPPIDPQVQIPPSKTTETPGALQVVVQPGPIKNYEKLPRDRTALDNVMEGVWGQESGNQHFSRPGVVKRNPDSGATGVSQLMPGTAKELGVNADDEAQNREGGKRYLAQQFDKYGNWDDALAAYNWGPDNLDKWIAGGRDPAKMPAETRAYVPSVLSRVGLELSPTGKVMQGKREGTTDDLRDLVNEGKPAAPSSFQLDPTQAQQITESDRNALGMTDAAPATVEAFATGMRRGVQNIVLGPAQAVLEQVAPDVAKELTRRVNEFEDQFAAAKEHPWIATAGDVVGTTLGLMGAAKLLGPGVGVAAKAILPQFLARTGLITRGAAGGFALGATSWNPSPEESSRVLEGVVGGTIGTLGGTIAKGIGAATRKLADVNAYNNFISSVRGAIDGLAPSTSKLKDLFLQHYDDLWKTKNELYTIRNSAGKEIEGFPREEVGRPAVDAMQASRAAGVAPTPTTRAIATQVDRELGGPESRAAEAQHNAAVKEHDKEMAAWQKEYVPRNIPIGLRDVQANDLRRRIAAGEVPPPPIAPGEFEAPPITAEQLSSAIQAVNRQFVRSRSDPTTQAQLRAMSREMMSAAETAAQDAGMSVEEFMRASTLAGRYFKENIGPIYRQFRNQSPEQLRGDPAIAFSGMSPAKFFDYAGNILEGNDKAAVESLAKIMGERAKPELVKIAAYRMMQKLDKIEDKAKMPESLAAYLKDHADNLEILLGREGLQNLKGVEKIAEQLIREPTKYSQLHRLLASHRWLQAIGAVRVVEGSLTGEPRKALTGGAMILGPWVGHHIYEIAHKTLDNPQIVPIVKRASTLRPGSAELDRAIEEIQRRVIRDAAVAARLSAPAGNVGAPLVP